MKTGAVSASNMAGHVQYVPETKKHLTFTTDEAQAFSARREKNRVGTYYPENDSKYPVRYLVTDEPLYITDIARGNSERFGPRYSSESVKTYIGGWQTGAWDAEKYRNLYARLKCIRLTEGDIKDKRERELIGQYGVKTCDFIKEGEVVAFYAGVDIPYGLIGEEYLPFNLVQHEGQRALDGDNIGSRVNTIFEYKDGVPIKQASSGYNLNIASFLVNTLLFLDDDMAAKKTNLLRCLFAAEDIPADTELRWNYNLSEAEIRKMVESQSNKH